MALCVTIERPRAEFQHLLRLQVLQTRVHDSG